MKKIINFFNNMFKTRYEIIEHKYEDKTSDKLYSTGYSIRYRCWYDLYYYKPTYIYRTRGGYVENNFSSLELAKVVLDEILCIAELTSSKSKVVYKVMI